MHKLDILLNQNYLNISLDIFLVERKNPHFLLIPIKELIALLLTKLDNFLGGMFKKTYSLNNEASLFSLARLV